MISRTTSSNFGKRAIKKMAPKEMIEVIDAFKTLVEKETGSSRKAKEMENTCMRVGVKIYFLVLDGNVAPSKVLIHLSLERRR